VTWQQESILPATPRAKISREIISGHLFQTLGLFCARKRARRKNDILRSWGPYVRYSENEAAPAAL
jgi:hypothetical protein